MKGVEVAAELAPRFAERAAEYDREAEFPVADVADIRAGGLLGLLVPERLGGMGGDFEDYIQVAAVLARGNASTALLFNMHAAVTGGLAEVPDELARSLGAGDDFFEHRDDVLRRAAAGAMYGVAITEREVGSRMSAVRSTYEPEEDGFRLRGHKSVCSGAGHLDAYLVAARARHHNSDPPVVSYFLVPAGPGVAVTENWDPLGMRATASNELDLDVWVPRQALVGGVEGLTLLLAYALPHWLVASYAAIYVGLAEAALDEAKTYISQREVAGSKAGLGALVSVRLRLGRIDADVSAARLVLERAGSQVTVAPGEAATHRWVYRAKLLAGDVAMRAAASLTEACGLGSLRRGMALERIFRDARCGAIMPPSSDVSADYLGTMLLGRDPQTEGTPPW